MLVVAVVRDRLAAAGPALPLLLDVFLALAYTLLTVLWVESVQEKRRPAAPHQAIP
jgi:predicted outer membrane lipoprotein